MNKLTNILVGWYSMWYTWTKLCMGLDTGFGSLILPSPGLSTFTLSTCWLTEAWGCYKWDTWSDKMGSSGSPTSVHSNLTIDTRCTKPGDILGSRESDSMDSLLAMGGMSIISVGCLPIELQGRGDKASGKNKRNLYLSKGKLGSLYKSTWTRTRKYANMDNGWKYQVKHLVLNIATTFKTGISHVISER